jgi:phage tail sheath protein FI
MPVTTSFPGVYIQELPSNAHTIAAAPTSVTVFVGYSHPFKSPLPPFGAPQEIFSFSDYERLYGGIFQSSVIDNNLAYAVSQFFLNGGSDAIIVALQPAYRDATDTPTTITAGTATVAGIAFTALQPTDIAATSGSPGTVMKIVIGNVQPGATIADITITYASQQEVYRKVNLTATDPNFYATRINGVSSLVSASATAPASFGTGGNGSIDTSVGQAGGVPAGTVGVFSPGDYTTVFQEDSGLDKWPIFNLLVTPGVPNSSSAALLGDGQVVLSEALAFCERKLAFFIMDPPSTYIADSGLGNSIDSTLPPGPVSPNGAIYFPYLQSNDPTTGASLSLPPSGTVAGIFAREDTNRGVWKAPAGIETTILNATGVVPTGVMTDSRQGVLNNEGINCLRTFPGIGTVVFGARTLVYTNVALQTQWGYVPVRRMALFIEQTLKAALVWAIFEPNDTPLWTAIRVSIEGFMMALFNQGAFAGTTPSQAFQVVCDATTTTPDDVNLGRVNVIVAFAPLKPAEFVIVKITQLAGQPQS